VRIVNDVKLDYSDVLFVPKRSELSSRKEVELFRDYKFKHSGNTYRGIPIMAANMDGVGTFAMAQRLQQHGLFTCMVKSYTLDDYRAFNTKWIRDWGAVSTGTSDEDFARLKDIVNNIEWIRFICIDVANGYSERFGDFVAKVRAEFPNVTIIAGNVVTADMTQELILRGADIVKVGIGPGSVCTTRIQTGVGYPQLSAVIECADAAHGLGAHIIADGGCTCPGDVAKAFGAGADFVMLGGMLAGHDEGGGDIITKLIETNELQAHKRTLPDGQTEWTWTGNKVQEQKFVQFYGMSSDTAMEKHHGGVAPYRSSEGRTVTVPYRGAVNDTVLNILGGLRSTCTYVGARNLKQLSKCTTFVQVNRQVNTVYAGGNN
jgi:GMP reductase